MFLLQRVLRFILLSYALYSFATGIWIIIQAENSSPEAAENKHTIQDIEELGTAIPVSEAYDRTTNN